MGNKHYVYILRCKDGTLYTGYTNDIKRRLKMHELGKGAKYTRGRGPFELLYTEQFDCKETAMQHEYEIKQLTRNEKLALIHSKLKDDENENPTKL